MSEIDDLRTELAAIRARLAAVEAGGAAAADSVERPIRGSRRQLLKLAAATAAGAGATTLLAATPAAAADDPVLLGQTNAETDETTLVNSTAYGTALTATSSSTKGGTGISGAADDTFGIGVLGTGQTGVVGEGIAGVLGRGTVSAPGAVGTQGWAISSTPDDDGQIAVLGIQYLLDTNGSFVSHATGYLGAGSLDVVAAGTGRLQQALQAAAGAPTGHAVAYTAGEQIRDSAGELYLCVTSGSPGTWKKATGLLAGYTGGATHFLSTPVRLLDTRPGKTAATTPGTKIAPGTPLTVPIAGKTVGGVGVPVGAAGAVLNITALNATAPGFVTVYPSDVAKPSTSTLNLGKGDVRANGTTVRLSATGAITLAVAGSSFDVIVDAVAFVA